MIHLNLPNFAIKRLTIVWSHHLSTIKVWRRNIVSDYRSHCSPFETLFFFQVPRGPGSPPVPVMHSPPRSISAKEQVDWKIPPSISNWKVCLRVFIFVVVLGEDSPTFSHRTLKVIPFHWINALRQMEEDSKKFK